MVPKDPLSRRKPPLLSIKTKLIVFTIRHALGIAAILGMLVTLRRLDSSNLWLAAATGGLLYILVAAASWWHLFSLFRAERRAGEDRPRRRP